MLTILKLMAGAGIALGVLNPSFTPRADDCECKAKADALNQRAVPRADDCECKADASGPRPSVPHADGCECKADA